MTGMNSLWDKGWVPPTNSASREVYIRDPVRNKVFKFSSSNEHKIVRLETDFINIRDLNQRNHHNRRPGMAQFAELTHPYRGHSSPNKRETRPDFRLISTPITQFVDDSIAHHDLRPFRIGR